MIDILNLLKFHHFYLKCHTTLIYQFRLFHSKFYNGFIHSYLIYNSELKICEDALHLRLTRFVNSMGNGHTMSDDYYFEWNQWKRERKEYLKFKEENTSEWRKFKTSILLRHKLKLLKDVSECFTKCFDPN